MISVKNLYKTFNKQDPVVKNVSFEVRKGEVVGLLGPNGAGKSTIMKMLTGYYAPTAGEVKIDGRDILDDPLYIKKLIGYLPENTPSYGDMTVYEYLNFMAKIRGVEPKNVEKAIERVVKIVVIEDMIAKKVNQLSRGYQKRVGLASVMIHEPQILILDEPTSGLDPNQTIMFRQILRKLSTHKTVILSTHILAEIESTCERVIIIKKGTIVADDTLQNLIKKNSGDAYIEFCVEAKDELEVVDIEVSKVKEAWKIEFIKRDAKNIFRFRALVKKTQSLMRN